MTPEQGRLAVPLRAPMAPTDVERLCAQVVAARDDVVVVECWLHGRPDASVVAALARIALVARRAALGVRVRDDSGHLRPLLELCGLGDAAGLGEALQPAVTACHPPADEGTPA